MKLTRRSFLQSSGALAACLPFVPTAGALRLSSRAVKARRNKVLVVVFLRGGADGLNLVVPHGDPDYYRHRSWIAVQRPGRDNGALDLDGFFGLHPWAQPLVPFFESGQAVALHAVGSAPSVTVTL